MDRFIVIPDSFKGTVSSRQACDIIAKKANEYFPNCACVSIPVADGGEGTADCFLTALGGEKVYVPCQGPFGETMQGYFAIVNGNTAIIEMAVCAGLPLVGDRKNPMKTTTFGVGQIMKAALDRNVEKMIIGLGGSATNDFACGALSALGIEFKDCDGNVFVPVGESLCKIENFSTEKLDRRLETVDITIMCDVKSTIFGKSGAAYIFAPQKGADDEQVALLDEGLRHITDLVQKKKNISIENEEGLGAAGAMAGGLKSFLNCKIKMGIETVLDEVRFDDLIDENTVIFTGEGKLDGQSLMGKVIWGIATRAKKKRAKVIVVAGGINDEEISDIYALGVNSVFSINRLPQDFSVSKFKSLENLTYTVDNIMRILRIASIETGK